jgi:hypothetical protein
LSAPFENFAARVRPLKLTYVLMGVAIWLLDLLTGNFLQFPILFVIPVVLSAWYCGRAMACWLAVGLPLGRLAIAALWELPSALEYIVANALIRIAVLLLIAYLVALAARQTRALQQRVDTLVKMCAWTRTVEYQGQWVSFEEYLKLRFNIETTHGMSPEEAQRQVDELMKLDPASR